jgi:hypothetical protein
MLDMMRAPAIPEMTDAERSRRQRRWVWFQVIFLATYSGIVLDEATTSLGFQKGGNQYEQNPIGAYLIANLGWVGLLELMTAICIVCYVSIRLVYWRMPTYWSLILNSALFLLAALRWLAVITAVIYLLQPGT